MLDEQEGGAGSFGGPGGGDALENDAEVLDFLEAFERDRGAGKRLPLSHYLGRFRRAEDAIAREYLALTGAAASSNAAPERTGESTDGLPLFGHYRLIRELGRGGQGAVWLAEDTRLARRVALKVLPPGIHWITDDRRRRFRREAEVVARLEHAAICPVLEADLDAEAPYIAMRCVEGDTLAHVITRARAGERHAALPLAPRNRVELARSLAFFERTARALHAAHEAGVLHRDVKPGNVMVTPEGEPVVLDFGQARDLLSEAHDAQHEHTRTGDVFGTPAYMSPEQLAGKPDAVGRGTDVWALGATLYEALTLKRPFEGANTALLARAITEREPIDPRMFNRSLPDDVRAVLETALDKDATRRYASALDLAEDLRRVREYEPIRARPAGPMLRLARWARRRPAIAGALSFAALSLTLGLGLFARGLVRESRALDRRGEAIENEMAALGREQAALAREREAVAAERVALDHALARHLAERTLALLGEDPSASLALGIEAVQLEANAFTRAALLTALEGCRLESVFHGDPARRVLDLALVPGDETAIAALDDGRAVLFELATGVMRREFPGTGGAVRAVRVHEATAWIGTEDGVVRAVDLSSGAELARLDSLPAGVRSMELSADGTRLVVVDAEDGVTLANARLLDVRWRVRVSHPIGVARFALENKRIVAASAVLQGGEPPRSSTATLLDAADGAAVASLEGHTDWIRSVAIASDGARIATASEDGTVRLWDAASGNALAPVLELGGPVWSVAFSGDGARLAVAYDSGGDANASLFDSSTGARQDLDGHRHARVVHAAFDPSGTRLATASFDTTVGIWDGEDGRELGRLKAFFQPLRAEFSADGRRIVTLSNDRSVHVWFAEAPPDAFVLSGHRGAVLDARFVSDDSGRAVRAVTASADGTARVWALDGLRPGAELARLEGHDGPVVRALPRPQRDEVLTLGSDGTARLFTAESGVVMCDAGHALVDAWIDVHGSRAALLDAHGNVCIVELDGGAVHELDAREVTSCAWDSMGLLLAVGTEEGLVQLFDKGGVERARYDLGALHASSRGAAVRAVAFRPGVDELAVASKLVVGGGTVQFIGLSGGEPVRDALRLFEPNALAWDTLGERLLVLGARGGGARRLYDLASGEEVRQEMFHQANLTAGAFSPEGSLVLTAAQDGRVHVGDARTGLPVLAVPRHEGAITAVDLAQGARGMLALTAGEDGLARVWPVDALPYALARQPRRLLAWEVAREKRLAEPLVYPPSRGELGD